MLAGIRRRLTYANVASSLALFIAISGGVAFAVTQLDPNSVKSKHIVNGQVKPKDLGIAGEFAPASGLTGAANGCEPGFGNIWGNFHVGDVQTGVGYLRDPLGMVHLRGLAIRCNAAGETIFTLPEGFRPVDHAFLPAATSVGPGTVEILRTGEVSADVPQDQWVSLQGLSFRCASGQDGCP